MLKINKDPIISVIMPVYNAEKYLDEAIQSILNQTYKDFEFIIINDGSTDDSLKIIEDYAKQDNRIVLINRENRGLITSLNEGLERANGTYLARMDADDISLPERFQQQLEYMEKNELDICGCHYFLINEVGAYIDCAIVPLKNNSFLYYLSVTTPFAHPSVMIKKSFIEKNKIAYGKGQCKYAEDYDLWIYFWEKSAKFGNVDLFLFKYRHLTNSLSKKNRNQISREKKKLSTKFILNNQTHIIEGLRNTNLSILPSREQEFIVWILLRLLIKSLKLNIFQFLIKIKRKILICSILSYFK